MEQGAWSWGEASRYDTVGLAIHARAALRRRIAGFERVWDERCISGAAAGPSEHGRIAQHALRDAAADLCLFDLHLLSIESNLRATK
jgi:hypothetical protein